MRFKPRISSVTRKPPLYIGFFIVFTSFIGIGFTTSVYAASGDQLNSNNNQTASNQQKPYLMGVRYLQKSAEVRALQYQAYNVATRRLKSYLKDNHPGAKKPAVVLDIDQTVLDNSAYSAASVIQGFSFPAHWEQWVKQARSPLVPGAKSFLKYANQHGVDIYYVSNRSSDNLKWTIQNLKKRGLPQVSKKSVRLEGPSKKVRRNTIRKHHHIVLLLGDSLHDFDSTFAKTSLAHQNASVNKMRAKFGNRFIILPNSAYGSWTNAKLNPWHPPAETKKPVNKNSKSARQLQIVQSVPKDTKYGAEGIPHTAAVWMNMIRHAKHSIDIAAFYFSTKSDGKGKLKPILNAIKQRAQHGVKVHILIGTKFAKMSHKSLKPLSNTANIDIRSLPVKKLTGGVLHAKYFVVDGRQVFVGSPNWDWRALTQIHEIGARINDPHIAQTFQSVFDFDWHVAAHPSLPKARQSAVSVLHFKPTTVQAPAVLHNAKRHTYSTIYPSFSPSGLIPRSVSQTQPNLVRLIRHARHRLRIQVMTFSAINDYAPAGYWAPIDTALRAAAARGVNIQIVVSDWAMRNPMEAYLKSLAMTPHITIKVSHVPPAPSGYIPYARVEHCKYAVADNSNVYIGTGNWSASYFKDSVDASIFIHGTHPAHVLNRIFQNDWTGPYVTVLKPGQHYTAPKHN